MSRRNALIALAIASVALAVVLGLIDPASEDEGNPSIIDFEFAWSEERADEIRAEWGSEGEDAARLSLWLDYSYLAVYGAFLILAVAATRDFAVANRHRRLAAVGPFAAVAAAAAPLCDAVENIWLLLVLEDEIGEFGAQLAPILGSAFASIKFAAIVVALAYLIAGTVARLRGGGRGKGSRSG